MFNLTFTGVESLGSATTVLDVVMFSYTIAKS